MPDQPANLTPPQSPAVPVDPTLKDLCGFDEGTVLSSGEIIKGTYDDNNKLVGWHKEAVTAVEVQA